MHMMCGVLWSGVVRGMWRDRVCGVHGMLWYGVLLSGVRFGVVW